jgi:hypothetical protein
MSITNPTYDNLAQTAHALAGCGIALTPALWYRAASSGSLAYSSRTLPSKSSGLMHYETPEVSGGCSSGVKIFRSIWWAWSLD